MTNWAISSGFCFPPSLDNWRGKIYMKYAHLHYKYKSSVNRNIKLFQSHLVLLPSPIWSDTISHHSIIACWLVTLHLLHDVTENKVPQNRETREKMRKPRLKKFSNLFIYLTKWYTKVYIAESTKEIINN